MKPIDPRLLRYAAAARGFVAASAIIGVVQTGVTVAFAWLLTEAVTGALAGRDISASLLWLLVAAGSRGALIALSDAAGTRAAARTGAQLRAVLIRAVGRLGPGWLAQRNQAALAVTAGHGLEALDAYFARYIPQLVLTVIATPILLAVMWWHDWPSGLTALITLPLIPLFLILIGMATRTVQRRQWQTLQRLAVRFADTVQGLATLRLFGREQRAAERIRATADEYRRETMTGAAVLIPLRVRDGAAGLTGRRPHRRLGRVPAALGRSHPGGRVVRAAARPGGVPAHSAGRGAVPRRRRGGGCDRGRLRGAGCGSGSCS